MEGEIVDVREILSNGIVSPRWSFVVDVLKHVGAIRAKSLSARRSHFDVDRVRDIPSVVDGDVRHVGPSF